MTPSCAHPHCRTSLNDDTAVYCPHNRPFCESCVFEDGCELCAIDADIARLLTQAAHIWDDAANHRPIVTADDDWAGYWGERRKEERALPHTDPREDDRSADRYYENRRGA